MKGEKIYIALGSADDELLERYYEGTKRKKKRNIWIKYGAMAACLCIVVAGAFALNAQFGRNETASGQSGNEPIPGGTTENYSNSPITNQREVGSTGTGQQVYKADGTVVSSFASKSSGKYAAPQNGTWFCFVEVKDALEKYAGDNVTYFLAIDVFSDFKRLDVQSKELTAELERLSELGYHVGYAKAWMYPGQGERVPYTYVAGYFTAEELEKFAASADYGYAFHFTVNGDGSPVSSGQGIVCGFDDGRR